MKKINEQETEIFKLKKESQDLMFEIKRLSNKK